ncbi:MAG: phosphatidylglycerol lysyltransferase domain-containing protein [Pseudomonadota bacterium]
MLGDVDRDDEKRLFLTKDRSADLVWAAVLRFAPAATIAVGCFYLIFQRYEDLTIKGVLGAMAAVAPSAIALAALCGVVSLLAVSCTDLIAATALNARMRRALYLPWPRRLLGGFAGSVMSQSLGLGVHSGAAARARIYRANGVKTYQAGVFSLIALLGFIGGATVFAAALTLILPETLALFFGVSEDGVRAVAFAMLTVVVSLAALRVGEKRTFGGAMRSLCAFSSIAGLYLICAAVAFSALLPSGAAPDLVKLIFIVAVATLAGLLSGAPAGIGPFEAILLVFLPTAAPEAVIAAIAIFRLIYHTAPLIPAAGMVMYAPRTPAVSITTGEELRDRVDWAIDVSSDPDGALAFLGDKRIYQPRSLSGFAMYGVSGRIWLMLGDPIAPEREWAALIDGLEEEARAVGATLSAYGATERSAEFWERRGMSVAPLGEEGVLQPLSCAPDSAEGAARASKSGEAPRPAAVIRRHLPGDAPTDALSDVADAWSLARAAAEPGFAMSRWRPEVMRAHVIFSAWLEDAPVAFVSFRRAGDGAAWSLDVVRRADDAPEGTVRALVDAAVRSAAEEGAGRVSLSLVPFAGLEGLKGAYAAIGARLHRRFAASLGLESARRFQSSFAPDWRRRHLVAASPIAMAEALLAARRLILDDPDQDWRMDRSPHLPPTVAFRQAELASPHDQRGETLAPARRRA